jgi:hypothetical protein
VDTAQGFVGIGVATPAHQLELSTGDAVKAGGGVWLAPSDLELKETVEGFPDGLEILLGLDPVRYTYNGLGGMARTGQEHIGLVAQAVQGLAPYLVRPYQGRLRPEEAPRTLLALDGSPLVYLLINAVKTLHAWLLEARQGQQRLEQHVALMAGRLAALAPPEASEEISP